MEMVRQVEDEAARQTTERKEEAAATKLRPPRTLVKSVSFLLGREEELVLALLEAFFADVQVVTKNFYKFWIER